MLDTLDRIRELRTRTSLTLARICNDLKNAPSEKRFTNAWLKQLQNDKNLYHDGWYSPPPHGIICKFGQSSDNYESLRQPSFRDAKSWPRDDVFYSSEDIALLYASPVDKETRLIGDFGLSVYSGSSKGIQDYIENVLTTTIYIANHAQSGMTFHELYAYAVDHGKNKGLFDSNVISTTDPAGMNIGHTIPLGIAGKGYEETKEAIRKSRVFINAQETLSIGNNMAFTFEPRFSAPGFPDILFHMTILFRNGERYICHDYEPIFRLKNMEKFIRHLP